MPTDDVTEAGARFDTRIQSVLCRTVLTLVGLILLAGVAGASVEARAQVQIEQVEPVTSQIDGATQGQVIVNIGESGEEVNRGDVLGLIPGGSPPLQTVDGNSSVVFQRGDANDASVTQRGRKNEASATQQGGDNTVSIAQKGLGAGEGDDFQPPPFSSFPDVSADEAFDYAPGMPFRGLEGSITGTGNLAVAVQRGTGNDTNIEQRGRDNVAGVRLNGSNNETNLAQLGLENRYLLDYTGNNLSLNVAQIGSQNRLAQIGQGQKPFDVTMRGNGIRMIIRHDGR